MEAVAFLGMYDCADTVAVESGKERKPEAPRGPPNEWVDGCVRVCLCLRMRAMCVSARV